MDYLHDTKSTYTPGMEKHVFIELTNTATTSVEFSFDNVLYKQIDRVSMGSPLGPALANIFVGFYEEKLFNGDNQPIMYFQYMDNTFAMFEKEIDYDMFLNQLNS